MGPTYSELAAQLTFRVSFGFIAILHAWLIYYRVGFPTSVLILTLF